MTQDVPLKMVISIINYRTAEMTIDCVQSVLATLNGLSARVVVVDNLSADGSVEKIGDWIAAQPEGTPVDLVCSTTNSGFSGGHNQGIAAHVAEYYLVLNSDALLRPGFFDAILPVADANPQAGLFGARLEFDDGTVQNSTFRFHTPQSELIRTAHTGAVTSMFKDREITIASDAPEGAIDWASFACILLRGEMVRALGPMDEGYFLYYEDVEYSLRAKRAGWTLLYVPGAVAVHFRGGSGPVKTLEKERAQLPLYFYSSRTRFLYQAHGRFGLLAANLGWHLGAGLRMARRLVGHDISKLPKAEGINIWTNFLTPLGSDHRPRPTTGSVS